MINVKCPEQCEWLINQFSSSGNVSIHGKFLERSPEGILIQTILKSYVEHVYISM